MHRGGGDLSLGNEQGALNAPATTRSSSLWSPPGDTALRRAGAVISVVATRAPLVLTILTCLYELEKRVHSSWAWHPKGEQEHKKEAIEE